MSDKTILFQKKDHIGLLTLNRPKTVNALNQAMIEELEGIFDDLASDDTVRVLILTGAGEKGFCSGMDMKESAAALFEASPELHDRAINIMRKRGLVRPAYTDVRE